jgi:hypothetical protein
MEQELAFRSTAVWWVQLMDLSREQKSVGWWAELTELPREHERAQQLATEMVHQWMARHNHRKVHWK